MDRTKEKVRKIEEGAKGGKLILENGYKVWTNFDQC